MNEKNNARETMDPRLEEILAASRPVPPRDPEAVERGRARFMADVDALFVEQAPLPLHKRLAVWLFGSQPPKEIRPMTTLRQKAAFTSLVALVAIMALLFGGATITAYAAQGALPGDALYTVKTGLEDAQVRLSRDAANQAQLHLAFAERRLDEIARLIGEGRFNDIGTATREFESHTQAAIDALISVAAGDPASARQLATQISATLSRYAITLSGMTAAVPDAIRPEMEHAILASQNASGITEGQVEFTGVIESMDATAWEVDGRSLAITAQTEIKGTFVSGDTVKVHAFLTNDGSLTAREIESAGLAGGDDNANGNTNQNQNGNGNGNENGNQNDNENHGGETRFTGIVESMGPAAWVVSGQSLAITAETEIRSPISTGDLVVVRALPGADGALTAQRIELADSGAANMGGDDNGNENGNDNEDRMYGAQVRFVGTIESMSGGSWLIGGKTLLVTPQTDLRGSLTVGSVVEVRAVKAPDGKLLALRIELDQGDDNGNGNDNANGNTNDNANGNTNQNDNTNDNANGNTNHNANDNQNGNTNSNDNSGGGGSGNGNDNGNTNDNANDNSGGHGGGNDNTNTNDNSNNNNNNNG